MNFTSFITSTIFAIISGFVMMKLTKYLIDCRSHESKLQSEGSIYGIALWIIVCVVGINIFTLMFDDVLTIIEYSLFFLILISLSVVDWKIRKIPNELLLALLFVKVLFIGMSGDWSSLSASAIGLVVGFFVFLIPTMFHINIGGGDVKLSAVIGFIIGIVGLLQSMIIMSIIMGIQGLYLVLSKKGSFKSNVAVGPALSFGVLIALVLPISNIIK